MAQPTKDLYIWAENDVILPTANRPNKKKPQDSLILTGFDQSQKPAADEFNDILNVITLWLKYITDEKVEEFLKKSSNLSDLQDITVAQTNLNVYSKNNTYNNTEVYNKTETLSTVQINAKQINTGAGLQGGGDLSANRTISMATPSTVGNGSTNSATNGGSPTHTHALDVTGNVAILTGVVSHGGTIPLPAGYSQAQCKWFVSLSDSNPSSTGWDINESEVRVQYRNICSADANRLVTALTIVWDGGPVNIPAAANYTIIGIK